MISIMLGSQGGSAILDYVDYIIKLYAQYTSDHSKQFKKSKIEK